MRTKKAYKQNNNRTNNRPTKLSVIMNYYLYEIRASKKMIDEKKQRFIQPQAKPHDYFRGRPIGLRATNRRLDR